MDLWWRRLTNKGSSVPRQADTSSRCVTESVSGTHDFVVANYSRIRDLSAGDFVTSGTFSVGGYDWFLRFYPCGSLWSDPFHREQYRGYAAASVHLLKRETPVVARARVTIGLVDRHGAMASNKTLDAYNFTPRLPRKFHAFARKSKLTSRRYLKDDCVTISVGGNNWSIRFYPDGDGRGPGYASAFLHLVRGAAGATGVKAKFTLSLLGKDGKVYKDSNPVCIAKTFETAAGAVNSTWGIVKFVEKSTLQEANCFTVRCDLTVLKQAVVHKMY
ncbi:hypothetical protein ACQ4PT_022234 [Festuca glaucescens]